MTLLFPFAPNWANSYKVTREFKTDVITSRAGNEQRRAVRNRPRKKIEFTVTEFGDRLRLFDRQMNRQIGQTIIMPDYSRSVLSTGAMSPGGGVIAVGATPAWMTGQVVLAFGAQVEVRQVGGASSGTLAFSDTSPNAWPIGTTVYPALIGRLDTEIQGQKLTDEAVQASIVFNVTPTSEPEIDPVPAGVVFNGREVFLQRPNWGSSVQASFRQNYEMVDYGMGAVTYFNPITFNTIVHQATYLSFSASGMAGIEDTFYRAKGQRGEFYMPTWVNDLPPMALAAAGSTSLLVSGLDVLNAYAGDTVFQAICIQFADGSLAFNKVTAIENAAGDSELLLDTPLTRDVSATTVTCVSWMPVRRFASDGMTSEWITNNIVQSQLNVVSLQDLSPET